MKFLGHAFDTQILNFVDDRLRSVHLATGLKPEIYLSLMKGLMDGFTLIVMQSGERRLDLLETARKEGDGRLRARVAEFESVALRNGDLTYSFFEQPVRALKSFPNGVEAIMHSPSTTRTADLIVREKDGEPSVAVQFSLPRRMLQTMREAPAVKKKF